MLAVGPRPAIHQLGKLFNNSWRCRQSAHKSDRTGFAAKVLPQQWLPAVPFPYLCTSLEL